MKRVTIDTQSKTLEIRCPTTDRALTLQYDRSNFTAGLDEEDLMGWINFAVPGQYSIEIDGITPPTFFAKMNPSNSFPMLLGAYLSGGCWFTFCADTTSRVTGYVVRAENLSFRSISNIVVESGTPHIIRFDIPDSLPSEDNLTDSLTSRFATGGYVTPQPRNMLPTIGESIVSHQTFNRFDRVSHTDRRNIGFDSEPRLPIQPYTPTHRQIRSTSQCQSCRFYPIDRHANPYLVCAVHPYGPDNDECSDWEKQQGPNTENDDRISFNQTAIDPGRAESVSVFSICRRNESGEIEIIGQIEDRIGASFTINAPGTYLLRRDDRAQPGRVVLTPTGYEASINDRPLYRLETGLANHQIRNKTFSHRVDLIKGDRIERTWYQESDQQRLEAVRFLSFYLEWLLCEDSDRWERLCSYLMMNMPSSGVLTEDPVQRRVARDEINGVVVSTIRLPIDQAIIYSSGQEYVECIVFETKCFKVDGDRLSLPNELMDEVWTSTEEEAIAAHNQYCRIAQRGSENYQLDDRSEFARVVVTYTDTGERQSIELPRTIDRLSTPSQAVVDSITIAPNQELNDDEIAFLQQPLTWEEDEPQP